MKSTPGNVKLYSFLVSIFLYSNIFCQSLGVQNDIRDGFSNTVLAVAFTNPGVVSYYSSPIFNITQQKVSAPVSDTTQKKDRDRDGIVDSLDKCPDEKGVIQYDGCPIPDSDNDGIADDNNSCPTIAGLSKYKGCPAPDKDGDKINDEDDKCPAVPGVARYDGCPVGDKDGDGVNDDDDKCREVRGPITNAGCPENAKSISPATNDKRKKK